MLLKLIGMNSSTEVRVRVRIRARVKMYHGVTCNYNLTLTLFLTLMLTLIETSEYFYWSEKGNRYQWDKPEVPMIGLTEVGEEAEPLFLG
jgi:hypothetical protein